MFLIYLLFSGLITSIVFWGIETNKFLFIHDHYMWVNLAHLYNESFVKLNDNGGINYGIQSASSLSTRLIYELFYKITSENLLMTQKLIFVTLIFLLLFLSHKGFSLYFNDEKNNLIYLVTILYFISGLNIVNLNTGNFYSLNYVLSYASVPAAFYYSMKYYNTGHVTNIVLIKLIFFLSLVFSQVTFILPYIIGATALIIIEPKRIISINKKQFFVIVFSLVILTSYLWHTVIIEILFDKTVGISNSMMDSTASMIKNGTLNYFTQNYSWALYNNWYPKSILTFSDFINSKYFNSLKIILLIAVFYLLNIKSKISKFTTLSLLLILLSIAFGKGANSPFGFIFNIFIKYFPLASTVRSPDSKFAVIYVFGMCLLVLSGLKTKYVFSKKIIITFATAIVLLYFYPILITKEVIRGKNNFPRSGEFVTTLKDDYSASTSIMDSPYGSALIYPPSSLPDITVNNQIFTGKDLYRGMQKNQFMYNSYPSITNPILNQDINNIYKNYDPYLANKLGIQYVVIRKDSLIQDERYISFLHQVSINEKDIIYDGNDLRVYKRSLANQDRLISADTELNFEYVSPVEYKIKTDNFIKYIKFKQSYSRMWRLYQTTGWSYSFLNSLYYLFSKPINNVEHRSVESYMNLWSTADGIKGEFTIYYVPQAIFNVFASLSLLGYLILGSTYLVIKKRNDQ